MCHRFMYYTRAYDGIKDTCIVHVRMIIHVYHKYIYYTRTMIVDVTYHVLCMNILQMYHKYIHYV